MTREILRTDIELAIKLRKADRSDDEVIAALALRGVDAAKAAQLVDDLRHDRNVSSQILSGLEFAPRRRSRSKRGPSRSEPSQPSLSSEEQSRSEPPTEAGAGKRKTSVALGLIAAILVCSGVAVGALLISNRLHQAGNNPPPADSKAKASASELAHPAAPSQTLPRGSVAPDSLSAVTGPVPDRKLSASGEPTPIAGTSRADEPHGTGPGGVDRLTQERSPGQLVLDLQPDGLRIGGRLVTRGNALKTVSDILGAPTRTTRIGPPDTMIYAYDNHGLLIYAYKGTGNESIVLDCEAIGGNNGTTTRFAGSLRIDDQVIRTDMDATTLVAIKKLGLKNPQPGGGIFSGRYNGLELAFAYLKTPQRLSLIEIDWK
jgi:hypothetical protein